MISANFPFPTNPSTSAKNGALPRTKDMPVCMAVCRFSVRRHQHKQAFIEYRVSCYEIVNEVPFEDTSINVTGDNFSIYIDIYFSCCCYCWLIPLTCKLSVESFNNGGTMKCKSKTIQVKAVEADLLNVHLAFRFSTIMQPVTEKEPILDN